VLEKGHPLTYTHTLYPANRKETINLLQCETEMFATEIEETQHYHHCSGKSRSCPLQLSHGEWQTNKVIGPHKLPAEGKVADTKEKLAMGKRQGIAT